LSFEPESVQLRDLRDEFADTPTDGSGDTSKTLEKTERAKNFSLPSKLRDVPLTTREGVEIREECAVEGYSGKNVSKKLPDCVEEFRRWCIGYEDRYAVFGQKEADTKKKAPLNNAFSPDYTERYYARFADLERGLKEEYGARLHTALLSLTCSNTDEHGNLLPPVDHLLDLEESYDAVRRALSRALDGYRWEYCAVLEPHKSGYTHIHIGVFVDGKIEESDFHPVIDAHLRNCDRAERAAHDYNSFDESERPISIFHNGKKTNDRSKELENLSAYLSEYLGNYGNVPARRGRDHTDVLRRDVVAQQATHPLLERRSTVHETRRGRDRGRRLEPSRNNVRSRRSNLRTQRRSRHDLDGRHRRTLTR